MFNIAYSEGGCKKFFVSPFFIESNFHKLNTDLQSKQPASTAITTQNIGQQSVNYATSAGSANSATRASSASKATIADEAAILITSSGSNRITANWGADSGVMYLSFYVDGTQVAKINQGFIGK